MQNAFEILNINHIIENDELFAHAIYSLALLCNYSDDNQGIQDIINTLINNFCDFTEL